MVGGDKGGSWDIPPSLLNLKSVRTCMLRRLSPWPNQPTLDQLCSNFKLLRTLTLLGLRIEHIPPSIGKIQLVRYLDLSDNRFEEVPNSIANLVNLLVLNLEGCGNLKVWPRNFKNLINLRFLKFDEEFSLMPEGIVGMDNLQYLSSFRVQNWGELDGTLNKLLKQVRGYLLVKFAHGMEVEDEWRWQLPATISLKDLKISYYPGHGICSFGNSESGIKIERLRMYYCKNVKYLPSMSCLPALKCLRLKDLPELVYVEDEKEVNTHNPTTSHKLFLCLKELVLNDLPKLKGWRGKVADEATSASSKSGFHGEALASLEKLVIRECSSLTSLQVASPRLLHMFIEECDELVSIDLDPIPSLRSLRIKNCKQLKSLHIEARVIADLEKMVIEDCRELRLKLLNTQDKRLLLKQGFPSSLSMSSLKVISIINCKWANSLPCIELTSLQTCYFSNTDGLQSLHILSPHLRSIYLENCVGLTSVEVEAPTYIHISGCSALKNFHIVHPVVVQTLSIISPSSSVDWGSISNLYECSCLTTIELDGVDGGFIERLLSSSSRSSSFREGEISVFMSIGSLIVALASLKKFSIQDVHELKSLIIKSPHLSYITIKNCSEVTSVELDSPLTHSNLNIRCCSQLNNVRIPRPIALKYLEIIECPELSLNNGVEWDSFTDLDRLVLLPLPPREELPECLLRRQALGGLHISSEPEWPNWD